MTPDNPGAGSSGPVPGHLLDGAGDAPDLAACAAEQAYLDGLLDRVDADRERLELKLRSVRREADIDDPQGLMMRDREVRDISERLAALTAADVGLMFGRIDVADEDPENPVPSPIADSPHPLDRRYIGRIGVHDSDEGMRTLLMDWRAPQARAFYLATTLHPESVVSRRHIRTRGRTVTGVADEFFAGTAAPREASGVARESALLDAVNRARSPHMRDIVETIALEQDAIIRSEHRGVTVVQGAPGTGKTAVALHRAAYLLYTWREQLRRTGVLIIGPNDRFLTYISQVLPSLGESGVVLATPGTLLPGVSAVAETDPLAREVKGSEEMVTILREAVRSYEKVPPSAVTFRIDGVDVDLTPAMVRAARTRARRSRRPHNAAQAVFIDHAVTALAAAAASTLGRDPLGSGNLLSSADKAGLRADIREDARVIAELQDLWPRLTPEGVLADILRAPQDFAPDYDEITWQGLASGASPDTTDAAEPGLSAAPLEAPDGELAHPTWTDADVPLLDELAELLGIVDDEDAEARQREQWLAQIAEAQEALDILAGSASQDLDDGFAPEILMAYDVVDAEALAARHVERADLTTAERARRDPRWAYGHVIVDEAQELSAMAWRMVFRRCPSKWMTIVGDPAQTGNPAGVDSWEEALAPFVDHRFQVHELSVNYRTPEDIAALAARLLPLVAPEQRPATALRPSGTGVREVPLADVVAAVRAARERAGEGMVGVIAATARRAAEFRAELEAELEVECGTDPGAGLRTRLAADPGAPSPGDAEADEGQRVVIANVDTAKGLEFDEVVVVEPQEIVDASPQGWQDLYVAITRATQGLTLVHDEPLPWEA